MCTSLTTKLFTEGETTVMEPEKTDFIHYFQFHWLKKLIFQGVIFICNV